MSVHDVKIANVFYFRVGVLSVLCKDSATIKLHDIRHTIYSADDVEQASVERNIQRKCSN